MVDFCKLSVRQGPKCAGAADGVACCRSKANGSDGGESSGVDVLVVTADAGDESAAAKCCGNAVVDVVMTPKPLEEEILSVPGWANCGVLNANRTLRLSGRISF
jgi:hypothetical protein